LLAEKADTGKIVAINGSPASELSIGLFKNGEAEKNLVEFLTSPLIKKIKYVEA
jgi:hypothetical protein